MVTSPLTRAIQTTLGGFDAARLAERGVDIVASALHVEVCDTACDIGRPLAELREEFPQLQWGASVGADGSPLCRHKAEPEPEPEHEPASPGGDALAASSGSWWYGGEGNPARRSEIEENPWSSGSWSCRRVSCCPCSSMVQREPWEEADARVLRFKQWLDARPESCIVVVGHSSFFQRTIELLADKKMPKLANCEVLDCEVRARCMHLATCQVATSCHSLRLATHHRTDRVRVHAACRPSVCVSKTPQGVSLRGVELGRDPATLLVLSRWPRLQLAESLAAMA